MSSKEEFTFQRPQFWALLAVTIAMATGASSVFVYMQARDRTDARIEQVIDKQAFQSEKLAHEVGVLQVRVSALEKEISQNKATIRSLESTIQTQTELLKALVTQAREK